VKTTPEQLMAMLAKPKERKAIVNLRERIQRRVESDPTTIMDRNTMRERWGI